MTRVPDGAYIKNTSISLVWRACTKETWPACKGMQTRDGPVRRGSQSDRRREAQLSSLVSCLRTGRASVTKPSRHAAFPNDKRRVSCYCHGSGTLSAGSPSSTFEGCDRNRILDAFPCSQSLRSVIFAVNQTFLSNISTANDYC
jgi:hypothetical protein